MCASYNLSYLIFQEQKQGKLPKEPSMLCLMLVQRQQVQSKCEKLWNSRSAVLICRDLPPEGLDSSECATLVRSAFEPVTPARLKGDIRISHNLMFEQPFTSHGRLQQTSVEYTFGHAVDHHITSVNPDEPHDALIDKESNPLGVMESTLFGGGLDMF